MPVSNHTYKPYWHRFFVINNFSDGNMLLIRSFIKLMKVFWWMLTSCCLCGEFPCWISKNLVDSLQPKRKKEGWRPTGTAVVLSIFIYLLNFGSENIFIYLFLKERERVLKRISQIKVRSEKQQTDHFCKVLQSTLDPPSWYSGHKCLPNILQIQH